MIQFCTHNSQLILFCRISLCKHLQFTSALFFLITSCLHLLSILSHSSCAPQCRKLSLRKRRRLKHFLRRSRSWRKPTTTWGTKWRTWSVCWGWLNGTPRIRRCFSNSCTSLNQSPHIHSRIPPRSKNLLTGRSFLRSSKTRECSLIASKLGNFA